VKALSHHLVQALHHRPLLRRIAKRVCRGWTVRQRFYQGRICLDAVEHSWAWTGNTRYEQFDRWLQDALARLAAGQSAFLDVGANIGVMTLAVLLRVPEISAVAVEPNPRACELLRRSLVLNGLASRGRVVQSAVTPEGRSVDFDFEGSVTGHVTALGPHHVHGIAPAQLLADLGPGPVLVKLDVEGFEAELLPEFGALPQRRRITLVFELHPAGFRPGLDPVRVLAALHDSGAAISSLDGGPFNADAPAPFDNLVARWPAS
jgi:FkbM family methyltransferase